MQRPLSEQVVVITGASSGIGRETALQVGRRGASVGLAARNAEALEAVADEIERLGGGGFVFPIDVADWGEVQRLANSAVERYGRIDTWVNCAAASLYGTVEQTTSEEIARVIAVTLMGSIHGMKAAAEQMRRQRSGTIINVASGLGRRAVPLQAAYCAAKHGVIGFADSLRLELAHEGAEVAVATVLPSSVNTPLFAHARSKMGVRPKPIPPVYEADVAAAAIAALAEHPVRDVVVGLSGEALLAGHRLSSSLMDRFTLGPGKAFDQQRTSQPDRGGDTLFEPSEGVGASAGKFGQRSKSTSLYTEQLELRPRRQRTLLAAAALAALAARLRSRSAA